MRQIARQRGWILLAPLLAATVTAHGCYQAPDTLGAPCQMDDDCNDTQVCRDAVCEPPPEPPATTADPTSETDTDGCPPGDTDATGGTGGGTATTGPCPAPTSAAGATRG